MRVDRMNITIVGLGLIGGSMAYALRRCGAQALWGVDLNSDTLLFAEAARAIDKGFDEAAEPLSQSDLVILCLHPRDLAPSISANAKSFKQGCLITDTAGVRRGINQSVRSVLPPGLRFVGGHPMAGKEDQGFKNADADIFRGASYLITPDEAAQRADIDEVADLARLLGCERVKETDELTHDRLIAYTSHLPHLMAAALVRNPMIEQSRGFAGGSFRDATRVARINAELWSDLFIGNADLLLPALRTFEEELSKLRQAIEAKDESGLRELLRQARVLNESKLIPKP